VHSEKQDYICMAAVDYNYVLAVELSSYMIKVPIFVTTLCLFEMQCGVKSLRT
jgi:hypothetical protein